MRSVVLTAVLVPEVVRAGGPIAALTARPERGSINYGAPADVMHVSVPGAAGPGARLDENGAVTDWQPDPGIRRDVLTLTLNALDDDAAAAQLDAILRPIVSADVPALPSAEAEVGLVGDAVAVFRLFTAPDRPAAEAAVNALGSDLTARLAGISPLPVADAIDVPVFLLHGRPDTAIPVAHAAALRDAIGAEVARLTVFGRFGHGQPGSDGLDLEDAGDILELSLFLRDIVAAATE